MPNTDNSTAVTRRKAPAALKQMDEGGLAQALHLASNAAALVSGSSRQTLVAWDALTQTERELYHGMARSLLANYLIVKRGPMGTPRKGISPRKAG